MKCRIAIISDHASPLCQPGSVDCGGQNVYVAELAAGLVRLGWKVDVFTRRASPDEPPVVRCRSGVRVIHVPAGPPGPLPKEQLLAHMPAFHRFMVAFMRRERVRYDLVHANFWMSGLVAMRLKEDQGLPFVITFHALGKVRRAYQGAADAFPDQRQLIEEEIAAAADRIIAECPQDEEDIVRLYGADPARVCVVTCGVDVQEMHPVDRSRARRALGLPQDVPVLLQLGRLVPRKGVDNVIRGFARFSGGMAPDARLVVVGGETEWPDERLTPEIGRLRRIAVDEGVAGRVVFTGRRDRSMLRTCYSAADVFVTTPWYEPFGITPLEAMACGTPVVASAVGGLKHTVIDGVTGRLVPANDPDALGRCLCSLFRDPARLRALGEAGRRRVTRHYQWTHVVGRIAEVCEAVAAPPVPVFAGAEDEPFAATLAPSAL